METPRSRALLALSKETFDLAIVGGGITGAGIARDAAARGLKVALVEKDDFGSGTSSKSSKLVHGGLRYLEMAEFGLVFESVSERKRLMSLARHLVRPLPFLVTNFKGDKRWLTTLDFGLWIYDALCFFQSYKNHRTYGPRRTLELEPHLRTQGLNGGILYYDCLTDDARLTLENALDARELGAVVLNHVKATALLKNGSERITGVSVTDSESGATIDVQARVVINATGPWSDEIRALVGEGPILAPTKGIHAVIDSARLPIRHALMLNSPRDRRVVFAIPWGFGRSIIGTTDTFFDGSPDSVEPTPADVEYLLETGNAYFPEAKLTPDDVLATWSGLRPLLKPVDTGVGASQVSREHMVYERPGFVTVAGGKLTTYRRMALEVVDRAMTQLNTAARSPTATRPLPGARGLEGSDELFFGLIGELSKRFGLSDEASHYFVETYGTRAATVLERASGERLDPELPWLTTQVDEAIDTEFACTLDDVLARRLPMILRARDQGLAAAPVVAARMARRLNWSAQREADELTRYRGLVNASRRFRA